MYEEAFEMEDPTLYRAEAYNNPAHSQISIDGGYVNPPPARVDRRADIGIGIDEPRRAEDFAVSSILQGYADTVVKSWPYTASPGHGGSKLDLKKKVEGDAVLEDQSTIVHNSKYIAANAAKDGTQFRPLHVDINHANNQYMFPNQYARKVLGTPPQPDINFVDLTKLRIEQFAAREAAKYKRWFEAATKGGTSKNDFKKTLAQRANDHNALFHSQGHLPHNTILKWQDFPNPK